MAQKHEIGKQGEIIAENYLKGHGYKIIERNFYCYFGEIDIIAKDKDYLVFIEVKTRSSKKYGEGLDSITEIKQKHIYKSAEYYLKGKKLETMQVRLDAIEVLILGNNKNVINHVKNIIMEQKY